MQNTISRLLCCFAAVFLLATGVYAQSPTQPGPTQPVPTTPTVKLTMDDKHVLKENLLKDSQSVGSAGEMEFERGKKVPTSVQLRRFPDQIASKIPSIKSHEYFVADQAIVVVEPQQRTIVEVVK